MFESEDDMIECSQQMDSLRGTIAAYNRLWRERPRLRQSLWLIEIELQMCREEDVRERLVLARSQLEWQLDSPPDAEGYQQAKTRLAALTDAWNQYWATQETEELSLSESEF